MSQKPKPTLDDDLDDLDELLDQFQQGKPKSTTDPVPPSPLTSPPPPPPSATTKTSFGRPRTNTRVDAPPKSIPGGGPSDLDPANEVDEDALASDFAKELAKGMESLMNELGGIEKPPTEEDPRSEEEKLEAAKAFTAAWEALLVDGMNGMSEPTGQPLGPDGVKPASISGSSSEPETDFAKKIRETMAHLKESESTLQGSASSSADPNSFEALLASMGGLGLDGTGGGEGEEELAGLLETMMGQLMSKDILYEPLKELSEKYPPYLANPPEAITPEEKTRFEAQLVCANKIIAVFEEPGYKDDDPTSSKVVVELMSEMQSFGSPPEAVMGPLPPGFGPDGSIPENCVIS